MCFFIQTTHKLLHFLNYFNKKDHIRSLCCLIAKVSNYNISREMTNQYINGNINDYLISIMNKIIRFDSMDYTEVGDHEF